MTGEALIVAALAAPLVLFALLFARWGRAAEARLRWLAPLPALAAAAFVLTNGPVGFDVPALRIGFALDAPGAMLMAVSAILWMAAGVRGWADGSVERDVRFAASWHLTMVGGFGVFAAADLVTFYLAYALVSIPAYTLVVANGDARAGAVYMAFAILGEALLLGAFAALVAGEPDGSWGIADGVAALPFSPWRDAALLLLIAGFGMKMALAPLNGWMPLTYTAAPYPAAAVLSGAGVKAGVIGLIRFLPLGLALPGWGEALAAVGFVSAFYGVLVGLTQRNPKTILAYSSISQMGVIAAALGLALAAGQGGAGDSVAFYAANHVLVKGGLFLALAALAGAAGAGRGTALVLAALVALSLAGLPLTGGYLAKLAVKDAFGLGLAYTLSIASSAGTALLMTHFLFAATAPPSPSGRGVGGEGLAAPPSSVASRPLLPQGARVALWLAIAVAALLAPWALAPVAGLGGGLLDAGKLWDAAWPVALGAALGVALNLSRLRLPSFPPGDTVVIAEAGFGRLLRLGSSLDRADVSLRGWLAGALSLAAAALVIAAAAWLR